MKKNLFFCLFFSIGLTCFSQEITVTSLVSDGNIGIFDGNGYWPSNTVKSRWDNLLERYNLVQLQDNDPFNPNEFIQKIGSTAWNAVKADDFLISTGEKQIQYI